MSITRIPVLYSCGPGLAGQSLVRFRSEAVSIGPVQDRFWHVGARPYQHEKSNDDKTILVAFQASLLLGGGICDSGKLALAAISTRSTVYPKKYAHGFCFAVLCCGYTLTDFPISIRLTSLALWQSNDCPSASKATLTIMDKCFMWIHYERLHNHNKAKHNKAVCIFLGIYLRPQKAESCHGCGFGVAGVIVGCQLQPRMPPMAAGWHPGGFLFFSVQTNSWEYIACKSMW